ncbi:MAG: tetratricopeptide repeat protein, partial [Alphaproteobacteria bacterium]|nr:tetratricopeptide repeat protein [Alphaproteobacteria bacterium]
MPDWIEPYVLDIIVTILLFGVVLTAWRYAVTLWGLVIWLPRILWRRATGYQPPKTDAAEAAEAAKKAEEAARQTQISLENIRATIEGRAQQAETGGASLPEDTVERAVAAMREILQSNDASKEEAQKAVRDGDVAAVEAALEAAFEREAHAAARMDDETLQLKVKAARTAREKAALAATRSVESAIEWYEKAAAFDPSHCWSWIELARLYTAKGDLGQALQAAETARDTATDDRERSVAYNEIGDVRVAQGELATALDSFRASLAIAERLAAADPGNAGWQRDLSVSHNK